MSGKPSRIADWARRAGFVAALSLCAVSTVVGTARAEQILVFAASSLQNALDESAAKFQRAGDHTVRISYAASSTLARQIEHGAPADLFISAHPLWMDYVQERSLIDMASLTRLIANELVIVAPRDSAVELTIAPGFGLASALGDGRLALADPDHVPAGIYAKAALQSLGVWSAVARRLAPTGNVRAALALVASQAAPLGIVYRSDAVADSAVRVVDGFAPDTHPPIVYPAAVLARNTSQAAYDFLRYLASPAAVENFARRGFTPID